MTADASTMTKREFTIKRTFDAPLDLVWKSYTEPEQLAQWWGPRGLSTPLSTIEMDVRPGGVFRLTMVSEADGAEFPSVMRFTEVAERERLVFAWDEQRGLGAGEVTVTFADLGDRTELTTRFEGYATDEIFAASQAGWASQIDKLDEYLTQA